MVRATIRALQRGYRETQNDPHSALAAMVEAEPEVNRHALAAGLQAVAPAFTAGARAYGQLRPDVLRKWAAWDRRFGILKTRLDVARAFDTTLVRRPPSS